MGTTIGGLCAGLALILSASAVSAQTLEDPANGRFARALEARVGDVLNRSVDLAVGRALASLEARELERLNEAALPAGGVVERNLAAAPARELPGGTLDARAVPAAVRTDEAVPKASTFVGTAEPQPLEALREGEIPPPLELVAHEPTR